MSILILSIICFMLAFLPFLWTMIATIFIGVCTIILAIIYKKRQAKVKRKKEISIIAIIISIMAIVISIVNFIMSLNFDEEPISVLQTRINSFENYSMTDEISVDNMIKILIKDISFDTDKCLVKIKATGLNNDIKLSINDFFIYNDASKEISFAKDSVNNIITFYSDIQLDEVLEDTLIFELKNVETAEQLYLVYKNDVNSVKIKL